MNTEIPLHPRIKVLETLPINGGKDGYKLMAIYLCDSWEEAYQKKAELLGINIAAAKEPDLVRLNKLNWHNIKEMIRHGRIIEPPHRIILLEESLTI